MYDVLIVGCGIVGSAMAYEISKYNAKVCVCERYNDVANGCTKANSAILHAGFDCPIGTLEARMNVLGVKLAKEICEKLDVERREIPTFVLAFDQRNMEQLKDLLNRGIHNGVPGVKIISGDEARAIEPALSKEVIAALYAPSSAIVNPWEYAIAMSETAVRNGVDIKLSHKVTAIEKKDGYFVVTAGGEKIETKYVINAGGAFSMDVWAMVGKPEYHQTNFMGQYYVLDKNQGKIMNSVVFPCPDERGFKGILVAPTVHGNLIVGPDSNQVPDGDHVATINPTLEQLKDAGHKSIPTVDFSQIIHEYAGVRPNTNKDDFVIGALDDVPGFINLAGIKSPGLSSAPAIALEGMKILSDLGFKPEKKTDYVDSRKRIKFRELSQKEKDEIIKKDPRYGKIICRCETITEGEIVEAIHRPIVPRTIDAIKRRCMCGLGRCQGGFCQSRVHSILARELGVSEKDIIMDEEGSYLLTDPVREAK